MRATPSEAIDSARDEYPVLIIDDHELFSTTLMMTLRGYGLDVDRVMVNQLPALPRRPNRHRGGLVILDLDLGADDRGRPICGADLVAGLRTAGWTVLVVSGSPGTWGPGSAAIAAGAVGLISKSASLDVLVETILAISAGQSVMTDIERQDWLASHQRRVAEEYELTRRLTRLTPREREVLELLADGRRAAVIAEKFVVSMTTVRTQIRSILAKLDVNSQLEAVALVRSASANGSARRIGVASAERHR